jgi:Flp pilus assembly protein TadD
MTGMKAALAAAVALAGLPLFAAAAQAPAPAPRALNLSRDERSAIAALQAAAAGPDRLAQDSALAAARNVARGADAQYALAHYQFEIGGARGDANMQTQAIDALVNSGVAQPDELPALLANQAGRAFAAGDFERTDRLLARMLEAQPNNPFVLADYGQFKARRGQRAEAVTFLQRAIAAQEASGRAAPEGWHLRALALAFDGRMAPQGIAAARGLVAAYPTNVNWRDALLSYRELSPADPALDLDVRRLMRAASGLAGERDYLETAEALDRAGLPGEAKAVLDEGISRNMLEAAKPVVAQAMTATVRRAAADRAALPRLRAQAQAAAAGAPARTAADAHFAFGQYGEAAELYRLALQKGGEDANLVNLRLGAALALAGRRPEAEAALRATTGPRADLAGFWLAWLARRPV